MEFDKQTIVETQMKLKDVQMENKILNATIANLEKCSKEKDSCMKKLDKDREKSVILISRRLKIIIRMQKKMELCSLMIILEMECSHSLQRGGSGILR